jgi:actin-related protein 10
MASSLLMTGGTCMLPGFFTRLEQELIGLLQSKQQLNPVSPRKLRRTHDNRFSPLANLHSHIAILNSPATGLHPKTGSAPAFSPHTLPWIGASLAIALKTSGEEITREKWDDRPNLKRSTSTAPFSSKSQSLFQMPDWTVPRLLSI